MNERHYTQLIVAAVSSFAFLIKHLLKICTAESFIRKDGDRVGKILCSRNWTTLTEPGGWCPPKYFIRLIFLENYMQFLNHPQKCARTQQKCR